jgi:hypothetical protein
LLAAVAWPPRRCKVIAWGKVSKQPGPVIGNAVVRRGWLGSRFCYKASPCSIQPK